MGRDTSTSVYRPIREANWLMDMWCRDPPRSYLQRGGSSCSSRSRTPNWPMSGQSMIRLACKGALTMRSNLSSSGVPGAKLSNWCGCNGGG
ncbi:hypothetical protein L1987_02836 [Smallanthus sonchifolius]|uniref:Uncharacterized protein n=1 Tax=Smallanthus sonchifolius TaxID=185202 RepID=A0ACB9K8Y5_9ASTR|nr:hypothetical protein L1987_02836 [Smallanthus sonchifolius]